MINENEIPKIKRTSLEEDGEIISPIEHWELFVKKVRRFKTKKGYKGKDYVGHSCIFTIPIEIVRHLELKPNDLIEIAIRKVETVTSNESIDVGQCYKDT